jgi:hypothetical protein
MPEQVFDALKVILDEFGDCDLEPRLDWLAGDDHEFGRQLLRAFNLVEAWHVHPNMNADDIRDCLEGADDDWEERMEKEQTRQEVVTP